MNKELETWLKSIHRNKHWWINPEGRWMDGDGPCVRDRGPASEYEIAAYAKIKGLELSGLEPESIEKCSCGKRLKNKCSKEGTPGAKVCLKEDDMSFKREERYMVIKLNKLSDELCSDGLTREEIIWRAANFGKALVECVVVESDWPEYETVWSMIEDRVK